MAKHNNPIRQKLTRRWSWMTWAKIVWYTLNSAGMIWLILKLR